MLTGKGPWSSIKNQGQVILAVMKGKEPPFELADSSEDARSFVSECFERNVEKRPTIEALLEHPFVK
jgi:serine/threonine protein kinase